MEKEKQINLNINDGESFFANEISVNFNPTNFFMDFKNVTPRIDPRSQKGPTFHMKHNVIMLEPYATKQLIGLMKDLVDKYEKEFGKIEQPKVLKKLEKQQKKVVKTEEMGSIPAYLG
ncbi:DUF3467 domain-containing protein [Candidatus Woesearchaeota archaeon]|nr:DUF3467 domain-containing protein [Candidatus Woesearchaeota archaeon]